MTRCVAVAFAAGAVTVLIAAPRADLFISGKVHGSILTIRTSTRTAGAIDSLIWRGKEFINSYDHGRELQSASSFDGYGECLNPTEAGSSKDGSGQASSSRLVRGRARRRSLETVIEMAYWLAPGTPYHTACGSHTDFRRARNETVRSGDTITKRVTIGADVISYDVTFETLEDHQSATFEALTAYMPVEFSEFLAYDTSAHTIVALSDGPGEQPLPVILSTPDHQHAMGIYSPGLPQKAFPKAAYGRWRFLNNPKIEGWNTVKWNAVYRESPAPKGKYHYRCYVAVGTLDDVRGSIERLLKLPLVHSMR